jgi:polyisoprenoid-binding protein YceI
MNIRQVAAALLLGSLATSAFADTYQIESSHTYPSFEAPHMGISFWRGKFEKTTGTVQYDKAAKTGAVDITVDMSTVNFGHAKMNEHAKGDEFFDVAKYPTATYKGKMTFTGDTPTGVDGVLTLHGVSKPVPLTIKSFKCIEHPFYKKEVCGADAYAEFNRGDFGISKYADGPGGNVKLAIQVEALKE